MAYTKLFASILDSTIWQAADNVRLVWITMLAMKNVDGVVEAAVPGLAKRAGQSLEQTEDALRVLLAPDPYSRTPDHEGRRIEPIAGGWLILNHEKYREMEGRDERRTKHAERQARYRERQASRVTPSDVAASQVTFSDGLSREVRHTDPDPDPDQLSVRSAGADSDEAGSAIPDRAFAAADYLRSMLLRDEPTLALSKRAWDVAEKKGLRAKWARTFDLLHRRDGRSWEDIAQTVKWLFVGQRSEFRFVVQSPESLRTKWDRIQAVRRGGSAIVQPGASQAAPVMRPVRGGDATAMPALNAAAKVKR